MTFDKERRAKNSDWMLKEGGKGELATSEEKNKAAEHSKTAETMKRRCRKAEPTQRYYNVMSKKNQCRVNAKVARQAEGTAMLYICMHLFFMLLFRP